MFKKKFLAAMLSTAMVASILTGCGGSDTATTDTDSSSSDETVAVSTDDSGSSDASGKKIGIAMPTKSLERWNRDGSYLEEQFKNKGYEVSLTYSDNKIDQQVKDIEGLIADDVDLLVIAAIDGESLSQVLAEAKEEDIPVISYEIGRASCRERV